MWLCGRRWNWLIRSLSWPVSWRSCLSVSQNWRSSETERRNSAMADSRPVAMHCCLLFLPVSSSTHCVPAKVFPRVLTCWDFFALFLHVVLYSFKTLVFNQGSTEPNVSVSSRQGFLRWPVIVYNNNGWIHQATQIYFWFWLQLQCYTLTPVSISVFSFFTKYRKMLFLSNLNRTNPCITA